ncbi:MAG TPA: hypothetical protein VF476_00555 [Chitinophagaceae bacterium]
MKKTLLIILTGSLLFTACRKEQDFTPQQQEEACLPQNINPMGRSYPCDSIASYSYTKTHCGLQPINSSSYWIYRDSLFTDGIFTSIKMDTLRFKSYISLPDSLIWWQPDMEVGLPSKLYITDSAIYTLSLRFFSPECVMDVKKEYSLFAGDTARYLSSFDDNAAMGQSYKIQQPYNCLAGSFSDCIAYEKNAPFFRKDVMIFKPGVGVVKYRTEKAQMGSPIIQLERISTLVSFYID